MMSKIIGPVFIAIALAQVTVTGIAMHKDKIEVTR